MGHERPNCKTFLSYAENGRSYRAAHRVYADLMAKVKKPKSPAEKTLTKPVGENLSFLVGPTRTFENPRQLAVRISEELADPGVETLAKMIHRIMYQQANVEFKSLQMLAQGLTAIGHEIEPWQLLVPRCNPANPRILAPVDPQELELWRAIKRHAKTEQS